jgi:4-alpha-glucanotransferase
VKVLQFENHEHGFDVRCRVDLAPKASAPPAPGPSGPAQFTVGLEIVINLLAPNVPDRYIEFAGERKPLEWGGVVDGQRVHLGDEWQDVAVEIEARGASQLWISPIETVSESEEGFERVYQGSQIMGVWNVTLSPTEPWSAETVLHVSAARSD